jgi:hypothetical protein
VAAEYDFNIAATKVMFSPLKDVKRLDIILPRSPYAGPKNVRKNYLISFRKECLMKKE